MGMRALEVERSNSHTTSLGEKVADTLETLALLKSQLEGLEDGKQIAASLENIRAEVIKTDPTLIWQRSTAPFVIARSSAKQDDEAIPSERLPRLSEARNIISTIEQQENQVPFEFTQGPHNDETENLEQVLEEQSLEDIEKNPPEGLISDENLDDLILANEAALQDTNDTDNAGVEEFGEKDSEEIGFDDIEERKIENLSTLALYLRDIEQFPIQIEKHTRWGEEIFAGRIALKALSILSGSQELLAPYQKEKVANALRKGKFLLERLDLRITSVNKRLREDKYENEQYKESDREFIEITLANEEVTNEILENARGVEDEEEREILLEQFSQRQINFANQGIESWNNLVNTNLRFVVSIAKRYQNHGIDLPDLIGYGHEGLVIAAAEYDPRKKTQEGKPIEFSTYAHWWIKQKITRALDDYGSMIRLPVGVSTQLRKRLAQDQNSQEDISDLDGIPKKLADALNTRTVFSLDEPIKADEEATLKDFIVDNPEQGVQESAEKSSLKDTVREILASLDDRESRVLDLRFGISDGRPKTLEEVGQEFGVTRERIRQIEFKALRKLRHPSRARKLRPLLMDE